MNVALLTRVICNDWVGYYCKEQDTNELAYLNNDNDINYIKVLSLYFCEHQMQCLSG